MRDHWRWAKSYYTPSEAASLRSALRLLRRLFGSLPAREFGPSRLRVLREAMIRGDGSAIPPRPPWSRRYVNAQARRVCAAFRWGASHEMLPASLHQDLRSVPALRRGKTEALERPPVGPVSPELVEAVRPYMSRQVRAVIDLQLLTGARCGELLGLRPCDIDRGGPPGVWRAALHEHKTAHRGRGREILFGPRAQAVLAPFLAGRNPDSFLFSPAEAERERLAARAAARTTPLSCGNVPGSNRAELRARPPEERYTTDSLRRAITRACDRAFPPPPRLGPQTDARGKRESEAEWLARLGPAGRAELAAWRAAHRWHPHQLRHNAATAIRRGFGLEAAQLILGHSSALVTDAVYAERDGSRAAEVARRIG